MESIVLSNEQLKELQKVELELLQELHRICKKCDIKYTIIAGTLLGAVRHNGFIPWDDDADVAMLRSEYLKFVEACKTELNHEKYYFQDHNNTPGYRWGYAKLRKKNTVFLRHNQEHMPYDQGVFIDIFPLDYVSNIRIIRMIKNFECFIIRKILWSEVGKYADKSPVKRKVYSCINRISVDKVYNYYDKRLLSTNKRKTRWVRTLLFPTANNAYGYCVKWYEDTQPILFEKIEFSGMKHYDEYLTFKFGDYMKLPPESARKVHPVSKIQL